MKTAARIIGIVLLGIVVLGVGILFFLTRLFDPNDYKEHIQQAARERANVELTLDGDIGWSLFPWLGMELKDVGVAPLDQPTRPLAQIGTLGLGVEVLPLLRRELRMSDVIVDSIALNLERDENGVGNWESVGPSPGAVEEEPVTIEPDDQAEERARPLELSIESVRVTNASLRYEDRQSGRLVSMEDMNLTTGALIDGQPFDLELLGLVILEDPALRMRVDLEGVALFDRTQRRYQVDALNLQLDASGTPFSGQAVTLHLRGDVLADLEQQIAELNQMRLSLADLRATGQLRATQLDADMQLAGSLDVAQFDAKALLRSLGVALPETRNPRALEQVALSAALAGNANRLMLDDLRLNLDGAELTGALGIADIERQALRFRLTGERLNIDDYLPPEQEETAEAPARSLPSGGARTDLPPPDWSDEPLLPLEKLAQLNVDGTLDFGQVQLTGQTVAPLRASVLARDGRVQLRQFEGGAFGGQFNASGEINARSTPVSLAIKTRLSGVDSLAVQQAYEVPPQFRGRLDLDADLRAAGNSMARWMGTLGGNMRFTVNEGALLGVNIEQQLCQAIALANRRSLSEPRGSEDTPFRRLSGSFDIADGRVSSNDLRAALPGLDVKGRGNLLLPQQRIDYRLGVVIEGDKSEMPDPACQVNPRYADIEWPLRCEGFLHNAARSCGVDTDGVARIAGRLLGNEAQRKVEERIQERLGDQAPAVRDAIRGLLGR